MTRQLRTLLTSEHLMQLPEVKQKIVIEVECGASIGVI